MKAAATQLLAQADALRKEIVATTEGGAITGEERLREHTDEIYGAINSVEGRPTNYQLARIEALDRQLKDVEGNGPRSRPATSPRSTPSSRARACRR